MNTRENTTELSRRLLARACLVLVLCTLVLGAARAADYDSPEYWRQDWERMGALGKGFVVWESNRTDGFYRIWYRNLDGSGLRQITPDEKGRSHYCAHISPDGTRLVYMSYIKDRWHDGFTAMYQGRKSPLHLINIDGTGDRILLENARTYQEHRAAMWFNEKEVVCIDENGVTQQLNVDTGESIALTKDGLKEFGWLINPTKTFAVSRAIWITFSPYDPDTKTVTPSKVYGGCQGYLSRDGRWGIYVGGSGGPLRRVDLATGKTWPIINKKDKRLPKGRGYMYFPMISASQRLFACGVAPGRTWDRDPNSDYDIFVAHCNPNTLELIGRPVRYSFAKRQDRFPDVFLAPNEKTIAEIPYVAKGSSAGSETVASLWPTRKDGLVFLWENASKANLATDPETGKPRAYSPNFRNQVWLNHNYTLHLVGNGAVLFEEAGPKVTAACKKANAFTLEATFLSAGTGQGEAPGRKTPPVRIMTLCPAKDGSEANATLAQGGSRLYLQLKTSSAQGEAAKKKKIWTDLKCKLRRDERVHLVVAYEPGKLVAYVNGEMVLTTDKIKGDLGDWAPGDLLLGGLASGEEAWSGDLEGIALYDRVLDEKEVQASFRSYRKIREARKVVPKFELRGKLLAKGKVPLVKDLGAYRSALVVFEYETEERDGLPPPVRFRVAHWGILDRKPTGLDKLKLGKLDKKLTVEFYSDNPQLENIPIRYAPLDEGLDVPLYFDTGR